MYLENSGALGKELDKDFRSRAKNFTQAERKNAFHPHMSREWPPVLTTPRSLVGRGAGGGAMVGG